MWNLGRKDFVESEKAQFPWLENPNKWKKCGRDEEVGCDSDDVDSYWRWIDAGEYAAVSHPSLHYSNFKYGIKPCSPPSLPNPLSL